MLYFQALGVIYIRQNEVLNMAVLVVFYEGESKDDMKAITATANPDIISKMADAWEKEVDNFFIPKAEHTQSAVNQKVMAGQ